MPNNPSKQQTKRKKPEEIVGLLARKHGVSARLVQMVINGERNNEDIFSEYMAYKQEHNLLLKSVLELVPFD